MNNFFRFFFGTPRRFAMSLLAIFLIASVEHFAPGVIGGGLVAVVNQIIGAVIIVASDVLGPLLRAVLPLILVIIGIRVMFKGFK